MLMYHTLTPADLFVPSYQKYPGDGQTSDHAQQMGAETVSIGPTAVWTVSWSVVDISATPARDEWTCNKLTLGLDRVFGSSETVPLQVLR